MSKFFVTVARQECQWCGNLYKTTRHDCKFDPEKRNCLTCKHNHGQRPGTPGNPYNGEGEPPYFECDLGRDVSCGVSDLDVIQSVNWNLQCDHWEKVEADKAKNIRDAAARHLRKVGLEAWEKEHSKLRGICGCDFGI